MLVIYSSFKQCFLSLCICLISKRVKPESNSTDPYETATQREGAEGGVSGQTDAVGGKKGNN